MSSIFIIGKCNTVLSFTPLSHPHFPLTLSGVCTSSDKTSNDGNVQKEQRHPSKRHNEQDESRKAPSAAALTAAATAICHVCKKEEIIKGK